MIEALTFLLVAQLVGEAIVRAMSIPLPGPVIGIVLLALAIAWRGIGAPLHDAAHGILRNLGLLFVPAGVGVIQHVGVLADHWLALGAGLIVSTLATLIVTAFVFRWARNRFGSPQNRPEPDV